MTEFQRSTLQGSDTPDVARELRVPTGCALEIDKTAQGFIARASVVPATDARFACAEVSGGLFVLLQNRRRLMIDATMLNTCVDVARTLAALAAFFPRRVLLQQLSFQLDQTQAASSDWRACLHSYEVVCSVAGDSLTMPQRWLVLPDTLIRNRCPPLGAEWVTQMLPGHRLLTSTYAAPIIATVDCRHFVDGQQTRMQALQRAVFDTVIAADSCHDRIHWASARAASDSFLQRRIAVLPQHVAAIIRRGGQSALVRTLRAINGAAAAASAALAHQIMPFPAMQSRQVLMGLVGREDYASWVRRWRAQTAAYRFRNRQLIALDIADWWLTAPPNEREFSLAADILATADLLALGSRWPELQGSGAFSTPTNPNLFALIKRRELATAVR